MIQDLIKQLTKQKYSLSTRYETLKKLQQKSILIGSSKINKQTQNSWQNCLSVLVKFSCLNRQTISNYEKSEQKFLNQKIQLKIQQILCNLIKIFQNFKPKITDLFIDHLLFHPQCYTSYLLFFKLNKKLNNDLLDYIKYDQLKKINIKIIAHFEHIANEISILHSLSKNSSFQKCQQNVQRFLMNQKKPLEINMKNSSQFNRPSNSKIPPLLLNGTKSISSSRYSISKQDNKNRGLKDLTKLAESLGQGFISVQLGILLANKRTQQVQEFTQNSQLRQKCIQKIQTDRVTSRLSMIDSNQRFSSEQSKNEEIHHRNFKYVLIINGNILLQKLGRQKQDHNFEPFLRQYIDIGLSQMIKIDILRPIVEKRQINQAAGQIKNNFFSLQKILSILMGKCSVKSQLSHLGRLMNRNKQSCSYHYNQQRTQSLVKDELLEQIQAIRFNNFKAVKGPLTNESYQKLIYQDFVIEYIYHYLKQLLATCDMNKQIFYHFETKLLRLLGFYLNQTTSNTTKYLSVEKLFQLLILIKRQLLQLSHPYINDDRQNINTLNKNNYSAQLNYQSIIKKYPQLFANYLYVISKLMTNNKHAEKFFSSIFLKNIFFMEVVQKYASYVFEQELVECSLAVLQFLKASLKIFDDRKNRNQQSKTLKIVFQNISLLINSTNGCIAKIIKKLEYLINPNNNQNSMVNNQQNQKHFFFQGILKFIWEVYYYCDSEQICDGLLEEQTASFYIKFSLINFVKLYSSLTVNEIFHAHMNSKQILSTTKQSPHFLIGSNVNQDYMIYFLRILSNISINRTPQISKKMRQYRILQFFIRQLELQFSVIDNIDKYIRKAKKNKEVPKKFYTEVSQKIQQKVQKSQKSKKVKIPSLNLTGQSLKQKIDKQQNGKKPGKIEMKIPTLKIPIKGEERQSDNRSEKVSQKGGPQIFFQLTKLNLGTNQSQRQGSQRAKTSQRHIIYYEQRKVRKIYSSKTLHAQCLLLVLSLVLNKGLLDSYYCDQFPITHGKTNILYILHFHLNHQSNKNVIPLIGQLVSKIKPYLSGQRLLKLLTNSFTDLTNYKNWKKINSGAYGVIYSCETNIYEPKQVAIKQMNFPKNIYERCVLHDIFTQITCLENFRLDDRVTTMFNYGVVDKTYVIVMKKYQCSLREWILKRKEQIQAQYFSTALTMYFDILKIVKTLHQQKVTHYDIKADNILLQINPNDQKKIKVVFGDFGECKIYHSEKQELDMKSRGTQCIKSPQMLTLALQSKKQSDHYDRRKKIGTTRASDIWSLGCLFYEILTGQFMFHRADWVNFYVHVTSSNQQLLTRENFEKLGNNTVLIQFLKFILIRDPHHRPSITNLIDKYEHLYALLVNVPPNSSNQVSSSPLQFNETLDNLVASYINEISKKNYSLPEDDQNSLMNSLSKSKRSSTFYNQPKKISSSSGCLMKLMNDIYYCDNESYFLNNVNKIKKQGITHLISSQSHPLFNNVFVIKQMKKNDFYTTMSLAFKLCPRVSDIIRQVLLMKGKLLFVNDQTNYAVNLLIYTLSYWFRCSVYQTWCLINTQILLFPALSSHLIKLSSSLQILNKIQNHVETLPKLQCICGSVTMILKKKLTQKKGEFRSCKCKDKNLYQNGANPNNNCPSLGCHSYIQFLKKRYCIIWDSIKWIQTNQSYFLTTLFKNDNHKHTQKDNNVKDSKRTQIILNSAEPYQNMLNSGSSIKGWKCFQCKICQMWMLALNQNGDIWVVLNNLIRRSRQGIMIPNAQQDFKMRTPALNFYTLSKLHMTSQ